MLTIQKLCTELQACFEQRSIAASVVFGNWAADEHRGAGSVIIGLGDFDPDASNFPTVAGPGPIMIGDKAYTTVAVRAQQAVVWVHAEAPIPTTDPERVAAAHEATALLLDQTIAALRGVLVGRGALLFERGQWPAADLGDITYGALAKFRFWIAIPVLGLDPLAVVPRPVMVETKATMNLPTGPALAGTIPTKG